MSRQPCTGMHRECDGSGPNGDRQKKGIGLTETKKGEETPGAPSGWLKIDSAILHSVSTTTTTESSKSAEVDNRSLFQQPPLVYSGCSQKLYCFITEVKCETAQLFGTIAIRVGDIEL